MSRLKTEVSQKIFPQGRDLSPGEVAGKAGEGLALSPKPTVKS